MYLSKSISHFLIILFIMSTWYGTRWYDTKTSDVGLLPLSKAFADHDKVKVELRIIDEIFTELY